MPVRYHAGFPRSARRSPWAAAALALVLELGCGPPREPRTPPEEPPTPVEPGVPQTEQLEKKAANLPLLLDGVTTSEHFGETLEGELRLPEALWTAYRAGEELPEGAQVALNLRTAAGAPRAVLWMEKRLGTWTFAAEPLSGPEQRAAWTPELCQRCHAEAPRDSLFRPVEAAGHGGLAAGND
jgi:hypothetical protein